MLTGAFILFFALLLLCLAEVQASAARKRERAAWVAEQMRLHARLCHKRGQKKAGSR